MNTSRRSFIKNSTVVVAGAAVLPCKFSLPKNSIQKVAIQLYSVDKEMNRDPYGTLTALNNIGYRYVEHAGYESRKFYGFTATAFSKLLKDCGLELISGHTVLQLQHWDNAVRDFTKQWHYTIEDAARAGQQYLITPWLDASLWNNETKLKKFMEVFNKCEILCNNAGIRFGYHNHNFEFNHSFETLSLYDIILQYTSADLVTQQLDIGNIFKKDFSISGFFDRYPNRFPQVHLKDIVESNDRYHDYESTAIGSGLIDIKSVIEQAVNKGGTRNFIIEQDTTHLNVDAINCARINYQSISSLMPKLWRNK